MTTRFWPVRELLSHEFQQPPYTIAPFLPQGGMGLLYGPPGVGKTQLALAMAVAVTTGSNFLAPDFPTTRNKVLLVELDITTMLLQERLLKSAGVSNDNLAFLTLESDKLDSEKLVPMKDAGLREAIAFNPGLIIIDTLRDAHSGSENDSEVVGRVLGGWWRLFPKATLILIHHDRKLPQETGGATQRYWTESARGSGAWLAKADVGIHLTDMRGALTLVFTKTRTCPPLPSFAVRLNQETLLMELTEPTSRQKLLMKLASQPGITKHDATAWLIDSGVSRSRAYELTQELMK